MRTPQRSLPGDAGLSPYATGAKAELETAITARLQELAEQGAAEDEARTEVALALRFASPRLEG